jgi:hypothetical protein
LRRHAILEGVEVKISQAVLVPEAQQNMFKIVGTCDLLFNKEILKITVEETNRYIEQ